MLRGLEPETNRKGIFISDADTGSADLPKGVQAWFPLQLTAMPGWLPFDPANAEKPARYSITPSTRSIWRERGRWCISRPTQTMAPLQGTVCRRTGVQGNVSCRRRGRLAVAGSSVWRRPSARPRSAGGQSVENWGLRLKSGVAPATRGWRRTPNSPTCSARTAAANAI